MFVDAEVGLHLLGFTVRDVGCCRILVHDEWGSRCFPSTFFYRGNEAFLRELLVDSVAREK